jgi:hypothetical protein
MRSLKSLTEEFEAALVVDQTFTNTHAACNGHFWQYNGPSDYVTFGYRTQASGFFHAQEGIALGGNENSVRHLSLIQRAIDDQLIKRSKEAAAKIQQAAEGLVDKVRGLKTAPRCSGTSLWLEMDTHQSQQQLLIHMRSHGILLQPNGSTGLIARPSLMFGVS